MVRRSSLVRTLGLAALLGLASAGPDRAWAIDTAGRPEAVITGLDQSLLDVMQHAKQLGYDGRYARLTPVVQQDFDVGFMTRIAVGPGWSTLSQDQQGQLTAAFGKFITATYARRFDGYGGETFETLGNKPIGQATLVQTRLVKTNGEQITLNYVTRESGGRWQVVDVYLTGTISELAQRHSEFSAVFQRSGFDGLLKTLLQKVAQAEAEGRVS